MDESRQDESVYYFPRWRVRPGGKKVVQLSIATTRSIFHRRQRPASISNACYGFVVATVSSVLLKPPISYCIAEDLDLSFLISSMCRRKPCNELFHRGGFDFAAPLKILRRC